MKYVNLGFDCRLAALLHRNFTSDSIPSPFDWIDKCSLDKSIKRLCSFEQNRPIHLLKSCYSKPSVIDNYGMVHPHIRKDVDTYFGDLNFRVKEIQRELLQQSNDLVGVYLNDKLYAEDLEAINKYSNLFNKIIIFSQGIEPVLPKNCMIVDCFKNLEFSDIENDKHTNELFVSKLLSCSYL